MTKAEERLRKAVDDWNNNYDYVELKFKDIREVLNRLEEARKLLKRYKNNQYYYKYNNKYLKSEIIEDFSEILGE